MLRSTELGWCSAGVGTRLGYKAALMSTMAVVARVCIICAYSMLVRLIRER